MTDEDVATSKSTPAPIFGKVMPKTQWVKFSEELGELLLCSRCRDYRPRSEFSDSIIRARKHECRPCHSKVTARRHQVDSSAKRAWAIKDRERRNGRPCDPSFEAADIRALVALHGGTCALSGAAGKLTIIRAHPDAPLSLENGIPVLSKFASRPPPRTREEHERALQELRAAAAPDHAGSADAT